MLVSIDTTLLVAAGLLLLSVVASKTSGRLGVPALLVFVAIGVIIPDGGTELQEGDRLVVLADESMLSEIRTRVHGTGGGPGHAGDA
jgi:NhaP-type Na+/H+ and K+/H+ antiporter